MIWRGCFQLTVMIGIVSLPFWGAYYLLTNSEEEQVAEIVDWDKLNPYLDYSSDLLSKLLKLKEANYPSNTKSREAIDAIIDDLSGDDVLALVAQNFLINSNEGVSIKSRRT